jgi:hypothetical protein
LVQQQLARARAAQADPAWRADYAATRPKVERMIGHLMRRRHGGRRTRVRGTTKVAADFPCWPMAGRTSVTGKALPDSRFHTVTAHRASQWTSTG